MEECYIDISGRLLANMRLTVEGAVNLYETDAAPLHRLAKANNMRQKPTPSTSSAQRFTAFLKTSAIFRKPTSAKPCANREATKTYDKIDNSKRAESPQKDTENCKRNL